MAGSGPVSRRPERADEHEYPADSHRYGTGPGRGEFVHVHKGLQRDACRGGVAEQHGDDQRAGEQHDEQAARQGRRERPATCVAVKEASGGRGGRARTGRAGLVGSVRALHGRGDRRDRRGAVDGDRVRFRIRREGVAAVDHLVRVPSRPDLFESDRVTAPGSGGLARAIVGAAQGGAMRSAGARVLAPVLARRPVGGVPAAMTMQAAVGRPRSARDDAGQPRLAAVISHPHGNCPADEACARVCWPDSRSFLRPARPASTTILIAFTIGRPAARLSGCRPAGAAFGEAGPGRCHGPNWVR